MVYIHFEFAKENELAAQPVNEFAIQSEAFTSSLIWIHSN